MVKTPVTLMATPEEIAKIDKLMARCERHSRADMIRMLISWGEKNLAKPVVLKNK